MVDYTAVSLPKPLIEELARLIEGIGFWPSIASFVREACIEKFHRERLSQMQRLKEAED